MLVQNLVTLNLSLEQVSAVVGALGVLEANLSGLISLTTPQKLQTPKMGDKSEFFCRQTLTVVGENRHVLPASVNIDDALADLRAREVLRPIVVRLTQLAQRASDTDLALGSDVMAMALHAYRALKVHGVGGGLEPLQKELSARFGRKRRAPKSPVMPVPG